jgi:putative protease
MPSRRPEVLAPAGDAAAMRAAVRAGADAVYFGLQGFNARARATNFDADGLAATLRELHASGVRGYVTLNTLVFDEELPALEAAVRACAEAGVDAVIVQDLGVARLVRALAPDLPIHASTQMTCTDAAAVELARSVGATRVILARELSLDDIAAIRAKTDAELEVFVHGALCIAYSGQCLTSEALGGRSANRGACAQACRLPYELVVDGVLRDLGDRAYLLSPEDLEASALVPRLMELGVTSLKIEGRLKGPEYVAATTALYRAAIDGAATADQRRDALQTFTRGSGPGFLAGVDHQRLVDGRTCDHRGLEVGAVHGVTRDGGRTWIVVEEIAKTPRRQGAKREGEDGVPAGAVDAARASVSAPLDPTQNLGVFAPWRLRDLSITRGDGVLVEGGWAGEGELGGRVWEVEEAPGGRVRLWLGPDKVVGEVIAGRRVFKTSDPRVMQSVGARVEREAERVGIDVRLAGRFGEPFELSATSARGHAARVTADAPVERARTAATTREILQDKLGKLGETPFALASLAVDLPEGAMIPMSSLNRARRALTDALAASVHRPHAARGASHAELLAAAVVPDRAPPPPGLFVLCRTLEQAHAAIDAKADGVILDFLELTGTGAAVRALRARHEPVHVTLAPPRIRKPGEDKIDRYLLDLAPDALLVRSLGALHEAPAGGPPRTGDFSLNVTNRLTAAEVLSRGLQAFTPSFDLDAAQLAALCATGFGPWAEVVVHHPMPLFHMEHCLIAATLSEGRDHRTCGRPCEHHRVSLRDRAGMDHPVEADVGCRNTVFHAAAQSAASVVAGLQKSGVRRWRIELVRETAADVGRIVTVYRSLLAGTTTAADARRALKTEGGYGVVTGTLRVVPA